ncbi:hypothetical protein [Paenibacillus xylanexedens]|uniref:hypothetical protein n=1 Tax=Paenibacillus xylanexedens TaxID=528191 RepID=UPI0011AAD88D|nr:hypothetical protein [Paenibacillus xylanexedens]
MGIVSLKRRGLIYQSDFSVPSLEPEWEVLPNDPARLSLTEAAGSLRLKHGGSPLYLFYAPLSETKQFVMDVQNVYNPTMATDTGGIAVFAGEQEYLMLEEYFDTTKGTVATYPWIRIIRDYNQYSMYWSDDRVSWNIIGSEGFDVLKPKVGLFLGGSSGENMDVQNVTICHSTKFEVTNIGAGTKVILKDATGTIVAEKTCRSTDASVFFDTSGLPQPFTGSLEVTLRSGVSFSSAEKLDIWGGDQYAFEPNVDLFFIDQEDKEVALESGVEAFLGFLNPGNSGYRNIRMLAKNLMSAGALTDVTIQTSSYKQTDQYSRLVSLAKDDAGTPGILGSTVNLGIIAVGEATPFWLQVRRETDAGLTGKTEAYFGLSARATYTNA